MIDVSRLVEIHDNPETIRRHKRILEELFYLCLNEAFERTINEVRSQIVEWCGDENITLPTNKKRAIDVRNEHCYPRHSEYTNLLQSISERHRYHHSGFTRDYSLVQYDSETLDQFNVLENIIFCNAPILEEDSESHFRDIGGKLEIASDEVEGPYIKMSFDLNITRAEVNRIIDKKFDQLNIHLQDEFGMSSKGFRDGKALRPYQLTHQLLSDGQNNASIAIAFEKEGLGGEDLTPDAIRQRRNSLEAEIARFTP